MSTLHVCLILTVVIVLDCAMVLLPIDVVLCSMCLVDVVVLCPSMLARSGIVGRGGIWRLRSV